MHSRVIIHSSLKGEVTLRRTTAYTMTFCVFGTIQVKRHELVHATVHTHQPKTPLVAVLSTPANTIVHSICTYVLLPRVLGHVLFPHCDAHGRVGFRLRQLPGAK